MQNRCESCGMPMASIEEKGGGKLDNKYCVHCCDKKGNLFPKEVVRKNMVEFYMKCHPNLSRNEAENEVDDYIKGMSAWSKKTA